MRSLQPAIVTALILLLSLTAAPVLAHEYTKGGKAVHHLHIKGRVTSPNGQPIAGAWFPNVPFSLTNIGQGCLRAGPEGGPEAPFVDDSQGNRTTDQNGYYEAVYVMPIKDTPECQSAFEHAIIDRNVIKFTKEGYSFN
jgi:hypothetical protein